MNADEQKHYFQKDDYLILESSKHKNYSLEVYPEGSRLVFGSLYAGAFCEENIFLDKKEVKQLLTYLEEYLKGN